MARKSRPSTPRADRRKAEAQHTNLTKIPEWDAWLKGKRNSSKIPTHRKRKPENPRPKPAANVAAELDKVELRQSTLTSISEWDDWFRGQTAFRRPDHADLGPLSAASLDGTFQRLPTTYRTTLLQRVGRLAEWPDKLPLTWADVMEGTCHSPGENQEAVVRHQRFQARRRLAENAARLAATLLTYLDTPLNAWPARAAAAAIDAAREMQPPDKKEEKLYADLLRIGGTRSKLDALTWTEAQVRLAADFAAGIAEADAKLARQVALAEHRRIERMRGSVWGQTQLPIIPAVPARYDEDGPDAKEVSEAESQEDAANTAKLLSKRAEERRLSAWNDLLTAWMNKAPIEERRQLLLAARIQKREALVNQWLTDDYEQDAIRARIETWGHEDVARACRTASVRMNLRADIGITDAHTCQILGLLGGRKRDQNPALASDWSLQRAREQAALNQETLENQVYVLRNEAGEPVLDDNGRPKTFTGAEAARAHRHAMRSQRYALSLAIQELCQRRGWSLLLLTTTLPAEWHANPSRGRSSHNPALGPIEARKELQKRHHRAMAMLAHAHIRILSPRAREGQEDGTPHDHLAAFVHPDDVDAVYAAFSRHFPETREILARELEAKAKLPANKTNKEQMLARAQRLRDRLARIPPSKRVACHMRVWTAADQAKDAEAKSTMASYIYGYAAKCLADATDEDDGAARNAVWAGQRKIRRWEVVGLRRGLRGQWQAIYRQQERPTDETLGAVWDAMRRSQWGDALEMLDALREQPVSPVVWDYVGKRGLGGRLRRVPLALRSTNRPVYECEENDVIFLKLQDGTRWVRTRLDVWEEEKASEVRRLRAAMGLGELAFSESFPRAGADAPALGENAPTPNEDSVAPDPVEKATLDGVVPEDLDYWTSEEAKTECAKDWAQRSGASHHIEGDDDFEE